MPYRIFTLTGIDIWISSKIAVVDRFREDTDTARIKPMLVHLLQPFNWEIRTNPANQTNSLIPDTQTGSRIDQAAPQRIHPGFPRRQKSIHPAQLTGHNKSLDWM